MPDVRPHMFVASHHKVGTVWMMTTFIRLARANGFVFVHLNEGESGWSIRTDKAEFFESRRAEVENMHTDAPAVFFDFHGAIPDLTQCKRERGARGIHIIRDPRDMLLSAVRFHLIADEAWLDEPNSEWGGATFREKLTRMRSLEDQIQFEIETHMGWTIRQMAEFDDQGVFRNVRYEDLIVDTNMSRFREILAHLGLQDDEIARGLEAYWQSSLFGERPPEDLEATRKHVHNSAPRQWETQLSRHGLDLIQNAFASEISSLGYPLV